MLLVRDLASAKHDRHLHLVAVLQQAFGGAKLYLVVMLLDLGPKLDLLEFHVMRLFARLFVSLALFVL